MLRGVQALAAWVVVNLFFIAINVAAAALIWALFTLGKTHAPELMEQPLVVIPLGLLGVAGALWLAFIATRPRGRARGRA
jgi:hypothetical protein